MVFAGNSLVISRNSTAYALNTTVSSLSFTPGISNSTVSCTYGGAVEKLVIFGNKTYNNTIENCTIGGVVLSMHMAQNNLINVSGNYSTLFADNYSNIGIGNILRFRAYHFKNFTSGAFIEIFPNALSKALQMSYDGFTMQDIENAAKINGYQLPRFGIYPNQRSSGSNNFVSEGEQIYRNRTINFNPYVIMTPFLGHDMLMISHFNATSGGSLNPTWISPKTLSYEIFPANKPVFRNFSIVFHNYTKWSKITLLNGWQSDPNSTVAAVYNITQNGTISYYSGIQQPGYYEYILVLNTPYETENSTTTTYSVGLSYCSDYGSGIQQPGYYPLAYKTLNELNVFWITNNTCKISVNIHSGNSTINCRGGYLRSSQVNVLMDDVNNVTVENCEMYGNGVKSLRSKGINLTNDTFISNSTGQYAIYADNSSLMLSFDSFKGYASPINSSNSTILSAKSQDANQTYQNEYVLYAIISACVCMLLYLGYRNYASKLDLVK